MTAATYRVTAPNPQYNGETGKCKFVNGVYEGAVEDGTLLYMEQSGYAIQVVDGEPELAEHGIEGSSLDGPAVEDLKGRALDDALHAAGLPGGGTAQDKRSRLAEYRASLEEPLGSGVDGSTQLVAPGTEVPAAELKGADLNDALDAAGLSRAGSADEKRARLEAYQVGAAAAAGNDNTNGV